MKKIKILMLHLGYGGVEKQTITMANYLADYYKIEIISFYKLSDKPAYYINPKIDIKYLYNGKPNKEELKESLKSKKVIKVLKEGIKSAKILFLKKHLIIKEIKKNDSDIYFSTRCEYGKLLSKYGSKKAIKLTQEHNYIETSKYKEEITKGYKNLSYIIVISKYHESLYNKWFKNSDVAIKRIENILDSTTKECSKLNNNSIISVGRLNYIKDFISLIDVFYLAKKKNEDLKLYLLGDGEEKERITKRIKDLKLEDSVIMPGFVNSNEVEKYMLKSDIYVMTSISECFPMVLLESYDCGLPVISFDILTGPREIVKNGQTGYLIANRDKEEMAKKINSLINDKIKFQEFGTNAKKEAEKYRVTSIIKKWRNIFK